jgi:hypothetical protein
MQQEKEGLLRRTSRNRSIVATRRTGGDGREYVRWPLLRSGPDTRGTNKKLYTLPPTAKTDSGQQGAGRPLEQEKDKPDGGCGEGHPRDAEFIDRIDTTAAKSDLLTHSRACEAVSSNWN